LLPDRWDELTQPDGAPRAAWKGMAEGLVGAESGDLLRRQSAGERLLESAGARHLFHPVGERPWRYDPVPQIFAASEWEALTAGVRQRADVLDAILVDLYGPQRLVERGVIPAELVWSCSRFQPPCAGGSSTGAMLALHGVDLIRDDRGRWHVLRDHADVADGLGKALLLRSVTNSLFPEARARFGIQPVTPFIAALGGSLAALAPAGTESPRTVVLTGGVGDPDFVEHSYLATTLGYHLVTGGDLDVQGSTLWLRSLQALERVHVVLRATRDAGSDPLELRPAGPYGVAGLTQVARAGQVGLANGLGSGFASETALAAYLGDACLELFGAPLLIPSVETLWCGDPEHLAEFLAAPDRFVVFEQGAAPGGVFVDSVDDAEALLRRVLETPRRFTAQRKIRMATTPVLDEGRVVPGRTVVRLHVTRSSAGSLVLPGGQAHVVDTLRPIFSQRGDAAKDLWIRAGRERLYTGRAVQRPELPQVDFQATLTARTAETLFWVGRNAENIETACRYARLLLERYEAVTEQDVDGRGAAAALGGLRVLAGRTEEPAAKDESVGPDLWHSLAQALVNPGSSVGSRIGYLTSGASSAREYLSQTTWRVVAVLEQELKRITGAVAERDTLVLGDSLDRTILALAALAGLTNESIVRGPGFRFLDLGRRIERALQATGMIEAALFAEGVPVGARQELQELVLAANESLVAYRRRYRTEPQLEAVLALLVTDGANPRSVLFQLDLLGTHAFGLPGTGGEVLRERINEVKIAARKAVDAESLEHVRRAVSEVAAAIHATWFVPVEAPRRLRAGHV
jgi:uncharacterized circularly permuted ATP-grasp superfamily protein/uncharacterized alpha-E superfamily protein